MSTMNLVKKFGKALKNTGNTAIGLNKGKDTVIAKHDVFHGTKFWEHISKNNFDEAQNSLNKMRNPALKASGQKLHDALKIVSKKRIGKAFTSGLAGTYHRAGHLLGIAVKAENMTNELSQYEENAKKNKNNAGKNENNNIPLHKQHEQHFEDATKQTLEELNEMLENKALSKETKKTISQAIKILNKDSTRDNKEVGLTAVNLYPTLAIGKQSPLKSLDGGYKRKSRKGKSKKGKRSTRKYVANAKKTRKSNKNTKRHQHRRTKRKY